MSDNSWEQRLDDLGQARELREELERVFTHKIAYVNAPQVWGRSRVLDAVLELPEVQRLLAAQAAVERVREVVEQHAWGEEDPLAVRDALYAALRGAP